MTTIMNDAQLTLRNADLFHNELSVMHGAAVGVTMVRAREPYRAIDAIREFAFSKKLPLYLWQITSGWQKHDTNGSVNDGDKIKDPGMSLQKVGGLDGTKDNEGNPGMGDGFYVHMYPHYFLKGGAQSAAIIQTIKEYCKLFSKRPKQRLVLVVPPGFSLPSELEEDVTVLDFEVPSYAELSVALDRQISDLPKDKQPQFTREDKARVIAAGSGMQLSEFDTAFARAIVTHKKALPNPAIDDIVKEVMKVKTEVVKRSEVLEVMPVANMENVGGLENLKEWLAAREACFGQEAADYGIEKPKGIGLFGPPGTGKSLIGKATAHALGKPLIKFDVSRVFAGLVGESEARVRAALKMIDAMAPCVVLLDEVDKAFQRTSGGDSGVGQRVLGAILTHMQESNAGVFWVVTGNRVENLPSELLRRGRLDEVFSVSVPDERECMEIINIHLRIRGKDPAACPNLEVAAHKAAQGYVPAEIEAAVKDAIIDSFTAGKTAITGELIVKQLENMKPLSEAFAEDFAAMKNWSDNNARPASKGREAVLKARKRRAAPKPVDSNESRPLDLEDAEAA